MFDCMPVSAFVVVLATAAASTGAFAQEPGDVPAPEAPGIIGTVSGDAATGEFLYSQICAVCHGATGDGGTGPSLRNLAERYDAETAAAFIMYPSEKMPAFYPSALTEEDVFDIAAFVIGL